jgi:C4-dicarboxylate-specific signal transduction histidine kinase
MKSINKTRGETVGELENLREYVSRLERLAERRKRAEDRIKQSAKEWETTFDSIADMVSIQDTEFRLIRVNRKFAETFKKKPEELIGKTCYEVFFGANDAIAGCPLADCPYKKMMETKEPAMMEYYVPVLGMNLEVTASPLRNKNDEIIGCVYVARDITGRKRMEENMVITDRLASIGELVAGVAHEINNPLTSVIGYLELILNGDVPDRMKEDIAIAHHEAARAAEVVGGLLAFARKHEPEKKLTNINSVIATVLRLRSYEQKVHNINVKTVFASDLPLIMVDAFKVQQVFLNIIINAEYFMIEENNKGTLTITTEKADDVIRISFADDGPGISEENLGHIFDPFFTTKEEGKGTGLGLSICHGIVANHNGQIYVISQPGKGARFVVELPVITGDEGMPQ